MARTGRPKKEINKEQFESLCNIQCTLTEIASVFSCSEDTIERWCKRTYKMTFAESFKVYSAGGKISLRHTQFNMAKTNVAMAIWLGKQYLGQRDVVEQTADEASTEILNEIADEIRKAQNERAKQEGN